MKVFISVVVMLSVGLSSALAGITQYADSSTFDYKYEMDTAPNNQDLDSNGGDDWWDDGVPTVSGGFATNTAQDQIYRGDFTLGGPAPSIWRAVVSAGAAADWTLEVRVSKTGGTQSNLGWFGIATANEAESNSSRLNIEDDRISLSAGTDPSATDYAVGTDFASGYHTIRIAHDSADNEYYYWVNETLLNDDLDTPIAGVNGTGFDNSTFIGDFSGTLAGDYSIDYIRIDETPYAIPEPAALGLVGLLGVVYLFHRRLLKK